MGIKVKARITKELFHKDDYYILSAVPIGDCKGIVINSYGNFTLVGSLGFLTVNETYEMILSEGKATKYGLNYNVESVPSLEKKNLEELSYDEKFKIMKTATGSDRLATNVLEAYPDFIYDVVMYSDEELDDIIDIKNIYGVGKVYYKAMKRNLREKFTYFSFINREELKKYNLSIDDSKSILREWCKAEEASENIENDPYYALIEVCGHSFVKTDSLLKTVRKDLIDSDQRCCAVVMDILHKNESEGNTRLNGNILYVVMRDDYNCPELFKRLVNVCKNSEHLYYDEETKDVSIFETYMKEVNISSFAKNANKECDELDFNVEDYRILDNGIELTDEQLMAVENFKKYRFSILQGSAGCVDCDTEYFNGYEWKKISEYTEGEKVLQYNEDGTANLVSPLRYVKLPCEEMYHFETKYGINQTLSGDHRIIYKPFSSNKLKEITMDDMYDLHCSTKGFKGRFITTFSYSGDGINLTDEQIRLMVATMADGSFYGNATPNRPSYMTCRFHIKKDRKKERLRELFNKASIEFREVESKTEGYTDFYYTAPRREKEFTEYWYNCNNHQLKVICEEVFYWDGSVNYTKNNKLRRKFSTSSKKTADFVQFALSACNIRATIYIRDRRGRKKVASNNKTYIDKSIEYSVVCTDRTLCGLTSDRNDRREAKTRIDKVNTIDGYKYCFTVPSHMLVLRRKDRIFITGNCGKSTSAQAIINVCKKNNLTATVLAPTGVASMRIAETTNHPASTIHLKCLRDGEINTDVLLVDEGSMIDLDVFNMMVSCIKNEKIRIVIMGDYSQINPVGIGTPYADLVMSKLVPTTVLEKVFRYGNSGIAYANTNTREGRNFFEDDVVEHDGNKLKIMDDWEFIQKSSDKEITDEIVTQYRKLIKSGVNKEDIMVLTAYNVGQCGTYAINNTIQDEFNPAQKDEKIMIKKNGSSNIIFRNNDIVINKKNDYSALPYDSWVKVENSNGLLTSDDVPTTVVYNGQKGLVTKVTDRVAVIKFDEQLVVFDKLQVYNLLLGRVQSLHSSQGQEAKYVICAVTPSQSRLLNKNLLYVANSRARIKHINIGSVEAYKNALKIDGVLKRNTWLLDLLTK